MPAIPARAYAPLNGNDSPQVQPRTASADAQPLLSHIQARQSSPNQIAIPATYAGLNDGPAPGTVIGIVLGSVAAFILLIWLFSALSGNMGGGGAADEEIVVRRERSPRSKRSRRSEMASRSPARPERVIRQERIIRDTSRGPPRSGFVVQEDIRTERRVEGDDMVEVIEENSSVAPRRKSKRNSGYR